MLSHMLPVSLPVCQLLRTLFHMLLAYQLLHMHSRMLLACLLICQPLHMLSRMLRLFVCSRLRSILQCLLMPFYLPPAILFWGFALLHL